MEDTVFIFHKKENEKCECEIDGKVYPCSSFNEAIDILCKIRNEKGESK